MQLIFLENMLKRFLAGLSHPHEMRVIGPLKMSVQLLLAKGVTINLLQSSQMEGIRIAEKKEAVTLTQLLQQLDTFRRKVQQQGIPCSNDR